MVEEQNAQPIDMSTTKKNSTMTKNTTNKVGTSSNHRQPFVGIFRNISNWVIRPSVYRV